MNSKFYRFLINYNAYKRKVNPEPNFNCSAMMREKLETDLSKTMQNAGQRGKISGRKNNKNNMWSCKNGLSRT